MEHDIKEIDELEEKILAAKKSINNIRLMYRRNPYSPAIGRALDGLYGCHFPEVEGKFEILYNYVKDLKELEEAEIQHIPKPKKRRGRPPKEIKETQSINTSREIVFAQNLNTSAEQGKEFEDLDAIAVIEPNSVIGD